MKVFLGIFLVLCVIVFGVVFTTQSTQGQKEQHKESKDKPTTVRKGQITDKNRAFSKKYEKIYDFREGKKLTETKQSGGIGIFIGAGATAAGFTYGSVITANQFLEKLSCEADAVVVGKVENKESHLSADETFVYSAYDFEVKKVIKDNPKSYIEINKSIEVTRPGGFIKIDEQEIKFDDASYESLKPSKEYLLFLKFVPEANGYTVSSPEGDFALENNTFKSLSSRGLLNELRSGTDSEILSSMVQSAVSSNCTQYLSGEK